ncbi:hypothetical protein BOX15_Mlig024249g1, partial [Macrostomum lignano]
SAQSTTAVRQAAAADTGGSGDGPSEWTLPDSATVSSACATGAPELAVNGVPESAVEPQQRHQPEDSAASPHPNHREMLSYAELELNYNDERDAWSDAMRRVERLTQRDSFALTTDAARLPGNERRNRYADLVPYDWSRVRLAGSPGGSDYINASRLDLRRAGREYLITQGPLPHTSSHFWLMAWQAGSRGVLMLCRTLEADCLKKCARYYPTAQEPRLDFPDVHLTVELLSESPSGPADDPDADPWIERRLRLIHSGGDADDGTRTRDLIHLQFTAWPDFGQPPTGPAAFLNYLAAARAAGLFDDPSAPPIVHCSAGAGRAGCLVLVDSCLAIAGRQGTLYGLDPLQELRRMRAQRPGLVQTPGQLRFCFRAIVTGARGLLAAGDGRLPRFRPEDCPDRPPPALAAPEPDIEELLRQNLEAQGRNLHSCRRGSALPDRLDDGDGDVLNDSPTPPSTPSPYSTPGGPRRRPLAERSERSRADAAAMRLAAAAAGSRPATWRLLLRRLLLLPPVPTAAAVLACVLAFWVAAWGRRVAV